MFAAACDFLREYLGEHKRADVKDVMKEAKELGIHSSTMYRAAQHLHVERRRGGKGAAHRSTWSLPDTLDDPHVADERN